MVAERDLGPRWHFWIGKRCAILMSQHIASGLAALVFALHCILYGDSLVVFIAESGK